MSPLEALQERRLSLLERIAEAADEVGRIDEEIEFLRSQDLGADLIQSEPKAEAL